MRLFELSQLIESKADTVVFTFGRFNPPTIGHGKLVQKVQEIANQQNADHVIFLSQTHKKSKDPLSWKDKLSIFRKMFSDAKVSTDASAKTPFMALEALGKKYDNVIMVVGSDRVEQFKTDMSKYVNDYGIEQFDVVSAGQRDPDAEGVSGASGTKAREFAINGQESDFVNLIAPTSGTEQQKVALYKAVRKGLGVK